MLRSSVVVVMLMVVLCAKIGWGMEETKRNLLKTHLGKGAEENQQKSENSQESPKEQIEEGARQKINYPVRFSYVDNLSEWWPPEAIAKGLGVPGFAPDSIYNYVAFAFWLHNSGPQDVVLLWSNPIKYFGESSQFGKTKDEIQTNIKKRFNDKGIKLLISAFGATEFPTSANVDPTECANKLALFVKSNHLDGVDIDWEDNKAMEAGTGEKWIITFMKILRQQLPDSIITHAPQGPYFKQDHYKNGGYVTVNKQVGDLIDFYNIQFYNQGNTKYDTYDELFIHANGYFNGTAVKQIMSHGVASKKIVVGKPVTQKDADNTGWMDPSVLGSAISKGYKDLQWYGGVMYWEYHSDKDGSAINRAAGYLKQLCAENKNCI